MTQIPEADYNRARSIIADVNQGRSVITGDQGSTFVSMDTAVEAVLRAAAPASTGESGWPDLVTASMPRNAAGAPAHPVLEVLAFASMPWKLVDFARSLQLAGFPIPKKAEAEYAAALAWLVGHALRDGEGWREAAMQDLKAMKAKVEALQLEAR